MRETRHPTLPKPLVATLLLITLTALTAASPSISHFTLIDASTGKTIRKLKDRDVITTSTPITIAAIPATPVKHRIVYTHPFRHVSRSAPYTLCANSRSALRLSPKYYRISAYVDNLSAFKLSIHLTYRPAGFPARGPIPAKGDLGSPAPPPVKKACAAKKPVVASFSLSKYFLFYEYLWRYSAEINHCNDSEQKLRMRLMSIRYEAASRKGEKGTVLTEEMDSFETRRYKKPSRSIDAEWCGETLVYLEACAVARSGTPVCATSKMSLLSRREVTEPLLAYRPPIKLHLAPGDTAKVVMRVTDIERKREGLLNTDYQKGPFTLASVVEAKDGYLVKETQLKLRNTTVAKLPGDGRSRGVTWRDNGSKVFLKYGRPGCKLNFGTYKERYPTQLVVSEGISSLVKQDTKLPTFDQPKYPPTIIAKPVTITVKNAKNVGGGRRADGSTPQLHYQWYLRQAYNYGKKTYAEPILGATGPSLPLAAAECNLMVCAMRAFAFGLKEYYVDVCNTFGCRRSEKILPEILPPPLKPGEEWNPDYCTLKGEEDYTCEIFPYCMIGTVVKQCPRD